MQFKYVGNPHDMYDRRGGAVAFGIEFPLNIAVDVTNPRIIAKLMGNHHFVAVDGGVTFHQAPRLIIPEHIAQAVEAPAHVDEIPASDPEPEIAVPVEPVISEKDALTAEAERLGIDVDKRWGIKRIRQAIDEARGQ